VRVSMCSVCSLPGPLLTSMPSSCEGQGSMSAAAAVLADTGHLRFPS
jgi:hypothetical protein